MRRLLIVLIVICLLSTACIKLGSKAQTGKSGEQTVTQSQPGTSGLAQTPGGLPSLETGGKSGSIGGINQPSAPVIGQSGSAPLSQSGSTSRQPSTAGGNMAQFNLPPAGSSQLGALPQEQSGGYGGGEGGSLPTFQSGPKTGSLNGFNPPPSPTLPAGVPATWPIIDKFYADSPKINVGEAVFVRWDVKNADSYLLDKGDGKPISISKDRTGYFVAPSVPEAYTCILTAKNKDGSITAKTDFMVLSAGQRPTYDKFSRCRTFLIYPQQIKKGEPVFVYWNVLDATDIYMENYLINSLMGKPDPADKETSYGTHQFWPPESTTFRLTHLNGPFPDRRNATNYDYHWQEFFVDVR